LFNNDLNVQVSDTTGDAIKVISWSKKTIQA
jgi:hypothetical protein